MTFDIDGFEILGKIGQGGMASVWKARQISLDRIVAIKVLSEVFSNAPDDIKRFQDEAQAAAKLKHPGIVQVHDAKAQNGIYYFIMEYVSGYTVGDWVRRKGVLSEKDALLVVDCVADALGYAWDHANIVHCDIKPDNIIIDEDGTVKVADLGLARTISVMESDGTLLDEIMGTPAYISPEQAQGETNLDFRSDIYSLGAMLYHLVTGKMMFEEFDDDDKLEKHITDTVEDPIDINPHLSKGVCWLIERMTAKDPDLRQESWEAVRSDINRVQHGHLPHGAGLPEGQSTVRRSSRRTISDYDRIAVMQERAKQGSHKSLIRTTLVAAVAAVAIAAAVKLYIYHSTHDSEPVPIVPVTEVNRDKSEDLLNEEDLSNEGAVSVKESEPPPVTGVPEEVDKAKELYEFALQWYEDNSSEYDTALDQFRQVERETRGTKYSLMAKQKLREVQEKKSEAMAQVTRLMRKKIKALVAENKYDDAIRLVLGYNGQFAKETLEIRRKTAKGLAKKKKAWEDAKKQRAKELQKIRRKMVGSLVMAILADDLELAEEKVGDMIGNEAFADDVDDLKKIKSVLQKALHIDDRILESFSQQYGETMDVYLKKGMRTLTIRDVSGDKIECRQQLSVGHGAVSIIKIGINDLSDYERLRRMGDDSEYDVALVKGIMAYQSSAFSASEKYFKKTQPTLSKYLLARLRGGGSDPSDSGEYDLNAVNRVDDSTDEVTNSDAVLENADDASDVDVEQDVPAFPTLDRSERLKRRHDRLMRKQIRKNSQELPKPRRIW